MQNDTKTTYEKFLESTIRVGRVVDARPNEKARNPAHILEVDFGESVGVKSTSAQIVDNYPDPQALVGRQVAAVVNLPVKKIAGFRSEVLLLAATTPDGSVLLKPDQVVENGSQVR